MTATRKNDRFREFQILCSLMITGCFAVAAIIMLATDTGDLWMKISCMIGLLYGLVVFTWFTGGKKKP